MPGKRTLFATFIGINAYPQNPLNGCVKDVLDMDLFLREQVAQQDQLQYDPCYLLSPNITADQLLIEDHKKAIKASELHYEPATFDLVTKKAFAHFKNAKQGDICVLYYSGHGSHAEAPEVFWHTKPDRQNETIVCVDSRDPNKPESRDIIDKELAYLLWDALEGKEIHCLVIMDCCHSGNNTRAAVAAKGQGTRFRYVSSAKNKIPFEDYLGYKEGFYKITGGKANIQVARYVHLAACRDAEKAQESNGGGLFSSKLMEVLRSGGTAKSYRELVQGLTITVRNRANQQNPVAYAREDADLDLQFLGNGIKPYQPSYEVRYKEGKWIMYGGAMHNIVPAAGNANTIVKIIGNGLSNDVMTTVVEVNAITSVLDKKKLSSLNQEEELYRAVIVSMANAPVKIGLTQNLLSNPSAKRSLEEAYNNQGHLFFEIDFEKKEENIAYEIQLANDNAYLLSKVNDAMPLFKREGAAGEFLKKVDAVCKWLSVAELKNTDTKILKEHFRFSLEKIEGKIFNAGNTGEWENYQGATMDIVPGKEVVFSYVENNQPAFRLQIAISKDSALQSCFIGALYMDSKFGIVHNLIQPDKSALVKDKSPVDLSWTNEGDEYKTILLEMDPIYHDYGINEITEFLKIFVSTKPIDLSQYKQESLKLEPPARNGTRGKEKGIGLATKDADGNAEEKTDWTVFTFPFRIVGPNKEKKLEAGKAADFSSFTIEVPNNFSATAFAATGNDLQRKMNTITRGVNEEDDKLTQYIYPPQSIWGDVISDTDSFSNGLSPASDNGIQVLEIYQDEGGAALTINEGQEIRINPKQKTSRAMNEEGLEETVVPYGYNETLQLYIPLGYTDNEGVIHIKELPDATPGIIRGEAKLTRSIGSSIKLFFKKIFTGGKANVLTLYELTPGQPWKKITDDPAKMRPVFEKNQGAPIVLLIHGIFGSMKDITGSLMEVKDFPTAARYVLAYDYENLSTPLVNTGKSLKDALSKAGFGNGNGCTLSIIAHSMGGLVARRLVETEGGAAYTKRLIFAGTPNAGSELAGLKASVSGLVTHALNVTGPLKYALTGLSFLLKKLHLNPGETLTEMSPGSSFLTELLNSKSPAGVQYSMLGGNTFLLKDGYSGDDYFLKKLGEILKSKVVYPGLSVALFNDKPNDMAVTLNSMQTVPGFDTARMDIVANDHLSYFSEKACQDKLIALLVS